MEKLQEYFKEYRIVVYGELNCEDIIFDGLLDSEKKLNLLDDDVTRHYHVITSLTCAMALNYLFRGCGKGCKVGETHKCEHACSDLTAVQPCSFSGFRIPCGECKLCFDKHKTNMLRGKVICERNTVCVACGYGITPLAKHECLKRFAQFVNSTER